VLPLCYVRSYELLLRLICGAVFDRTLVPFRFPRLLLGWARSCVSHSPKGIKSTSPPREPSAFRCRLFWYHRCWQADARPAPFLVIGLLIQHLIGACWVRLLPRRWQGRLWSRRRRRPGWVGELAMILPGRHHGLSGAVCDPIPFSRRIISCILNGHPSCRLLIGSCPARG